MHHTDHDSGRPASVNDLRLPAQFPGPPINRKLKSKDLAEKSMTKTEGKN
jgi:hypothetical protein